MKNITELHSLVQDKEFATNIQLSFATQSADESFDPETKNYTLTNLNPITIRGIVKQISPSSLVWKQYGLSNIGAVEIITEAKYSSWFETANKITIDSEDYALFREGTGGRAVILKLANNLIKVTLNKR